jgi:hypothetical protein
MEPRAGVDDMEKWKYLNLPGLELRHQPVASSYTDYSILAPIFTNKLDKTQYKLKKNSPLGRVLSSAI